MPRNNNDIIEILIECLVISKLNDNQPHNKECFSDKNIFNKSLKDTFYLSNKMIDFKLDKLTDIKLMENEYNNYTLINN
tara:strand:- start:4609 stop:4845 length:237 start_codon:yes stop_codon:yes gene_type:complete